MYLPRMPFSLQPVTSPEDVPTLTKIHLDAFIRVPVNQAIYPFGITPAVLSSAEARNRKAVARGSLAQCLKVVDLELGETIAFAIWYIFDTPEAESKRTDLVPREWGPDVNLKIATEFWTAIIRSRRMMNGKPHCCEPTC